MTVFPFFSLYIDSKFRHRQWGLSNTGAESATAAESSREVIVEIIGLRGGVLQCT